MTTFDEAMQFIADRSRAAAVMSAEDDPGLVAVRTDPETLVRALLSGVVPDDEMDTVVKGLDAAAHNALVTIALAGPLAVQASVQAALAQVLVTGIVMGRGGS